MMKIKKTFCLVTLFCALLTFNSCINHKRNFFISGKFKSASLSECYYLEIDEISKREYDISFFINVVEDEVYKNQSFFSIKFYKYNENKLTLINLVHLKESNSKTKAIPISYCDDNSIKITPYYPFDVSNDFYYLIIYETLYLYFEVVE